MSDHDDSSPFEGVVTDAVALVSPSTSAAEYPVGLAPVGKIGADRTVGLVGVLAVVGALVGAPEVAVGVVVAEAPHARGAPHAGEATCHCRPAKGAAAAAVGAVIAAAADGAANSTKLACDDCRAVLQRHGRLY